MKTYEYKRKKSLFDHARSLFKDMVVTYSKQQLAKNVEKKLVKAVRKEVKKYTFSMISIATIALGVGFLVYGLFSMVVSLLNLPEYVTTFGFGFLLLFTGLIIYLIRP